MKEKQKTSPLALEENENGEAPTSQESPIGEGSTQKTEASHLKPAPQETPQSNTKPSPSSPDPSPQKLLFVFLGVCILLVAIFYGVMLWGLLSGNVANPLFETMGIKQEEIQDVLLLITNSLFGTGALIFLFAGLVKFFQWIMADKNAFNRKEILKRASLYFFVFFVICGLWVGFFWLIANADIKKELQEDSSMIKTEPPVVIGLTSPATVFFDLGERLFPQLDPKLIRQINWDFDGDGGVDGSGPVVTHRFLNKGENNGRFPVRAEVIYVSPGEEKERTFSSVREVIISNEAVIPSFTATPEKGPVPLKVVFDAFHSRDPDGNIVLYEWDLEGDEEFEIRSESASVEKEFYKVGEYKVRLRVTGSNNDYAVQEKTIVATEPEVRLKAEISSKAGFEGEAPFQIELDGSQSFSRIGNIVRYEWRFEGDDKVYVGRKIQRMFRDPGEYEISLIVQNDAEEKDQITQVIKINKKKKDAKLRINTTPETDQKKGVLVGVAPFEVTFDSSVSVLENPIEWNWDFENDVIFDETGETLQYTFREPGEYNVRLEIKDADEDLYEIIHPIVVRRSGVRAKAIATPPAGAVPFRVSLDGSGSFTDEGDIIDYVWQMGDSEPVHYSAKISYEITNVGVFPVKLTILTSTGKTAETEILISARAEGVHADFSFSPSGGAAPMKIKFNPTASTGTIVQYYWDFGDSGFSYKFLPDHTYEEPGEYKVLLRVKDRNDVVSEAKKTIIITD